jgi:hypothetical protein
MKSFLIFILSGGLTGATMVTLYTLLLVYNCKQAKHAKPNWLTTVIALLLASQINVVAFFYMEWHMDTDFRKGISLESW